MDELEYILNEIKIHNLKTPGDPYPMKTMAGGSVANTIRGLSTGFGVSSGIIGAYGDDEQGHLFVKNMSFSGVDLSRLRMKKGSTAQVLQALLTLPILYPFSFLFSMLNNYALQCVCLVDASGNRTMRPCLSSAVKVQVLASLWIRSSYIFFIFNFMCFSSDSELTTILIKFLSSRQMI